MGACAMLPRVVGHGRAAELLLTGRTMSAEEGERWGFFNSIVPAEALERDAMTLAESLANGPTFAHMISVLDSALFGDLFCVDDRIATVFADRQRLADLLAVEVALARAEAAVGVIPTAAADAIAAAAAALEVDTAAIRRGAAASGVPAIELVRQLRRAVGPDNAGFVHRGATSQDIVDTAAILAIRRATALIEERLKEAIDALIALADRHKNTVMAGRTHGQQASPITFGLKAANWLAPLPRHWRRLAELKPRLLVVQFGGAAGTLAALGDRGPKVQEALARELDLGPAVPWHTQRDAIVEYGGWLALVAGSLGKMGQDLTLLAQTEVGEILESSDAARGGSSTMPHKANPIGSEMMVVAAQATAALLAALHAAAVHVDVRRKAYARGKPPSSRHLSGGAVDASPPDRRRALVLQFH